MRCALLIAYVTALLSAVLVGPALAKPFVITGTQGSTVKAEAVATFNQPWAMTFLPDGRMLVTTKPGKLFLTTAQGKVREVRGVPKVAYGGQGGLGDVVPHPDFATNKIIYLSYARRKGSKRGAIVVRATLNFGVTPTLSGIKTVWKQVPLTRGRGHYSHKMAFGPNGKLFISSGDRQQQTPAQDFKQNLGKIIRLNDDGSLPADNPFQDNGTLAKQFWTVGHRNVLGMAFDANGRLWANEMGPRHGDEFNLITRGDNYGWPIVSDGDNYSGIPIPDHDTRPEFHPPAASWVPSIAPSGLTIYNGPLFNDWTGQAFMGGLVSRALVRVAINGDRANEEERFKWGERVRDVAQGPRGAIWVLEDGRKARLLKLTP